MPSCMRLGMIDMGVVVANARYDIVARPNANAIGTPITMQKTSITTKKMTRLTLPSRCSVGDNSHNATAIAATMLPVARICFQCARANSRAIAVSSISAVPTTTAAVRYPSLISSVGVTTSRSS